MHRQTGSASGFRGYSSGGARALISEVDDSSLMQTMNGSGMHGEAFSANKDGSFKGPESPQNYGFTSVTADATKGQDGQIDQCAEGFMSYIGGSRSFAVCGIMDDRRHRLKNLGKDAAKGATAMYGLKEWGQQYLNTEDGQFITGNKEKKNRMQLVENQNGKKQTASPAGGRSPSAQATTVQSSVTPHAVSRNADGRLSFRTKSGVEFEIEEFVTDRLGVSAQANGGSGGGGGGSNGGGGQQSQGSSKPTGQKTLHKEETDISFEQNGQVTTVQHGQCYSAQRGSDSSTYTEDRKKSTQSTKDHTHIRFQDNRIYNDELGNWCTSPILVKKDSYCKE